MDRAPECYFCADETPMTVCLDCVAELLRRVMEAELAFQVLMAKAQYVLPR